MHPCPALSRRKTWASSAAWWSAFFCLGKDRLVHGGILYADPTAKYAHHWSKTIYTYHKDKVRWICPWGPTLRILLCLNNFKGPFISRTNWSSRSSRSALRSSSCLLSWRDWAPIFSCIREKMSHTTSPFIWMRVEESYKITTTNRSRRSLISMKRS